MTSMNFENTMLNEISQSLWERCMTPFSWGIQNKETNKICIPLIRHYQEMREKGLGHCSLVSTEIQLDGSDSA